jgi:hypothetical protein
MNMRFFLLIFLSHLIIHPQLQAQQLSPEATISILTCNPGEEVYSMYGHTAIRVNDPAFGTDVVFNYGIFSFETPNFLYRFAKGQTDYLMMGQTFDSFMREYKEDQRGVYEQVLNLSHDGKNQLFQALIENAKPENRVYRYNFFMDNCATRVRDMVERNSGEPVRLSRYQFPETYRDLIKKFHHSFRWIDLGIDLVIGKEAEQAVSAYDQMFLPEYLYEQMANGEITINGMVQPLVSETRTLLKYPNSKLKSDWPWPVIVFGLIFLVVAGISVRAFLLKKKADWVDYWLFALCGFAGLIIGWTALFSEHPAVRPNYNLLWAFPPHLFFAALWTVKKWRLQLRYYFWFAGGILLLSLVMGQVYNPAVYFTILTLLVRIVANLFPQKI